MRLSLLLLVPALAAGASGQGCTRPVPPPAGFPLQFDAVVPVVYSDGYATFGSLLRPQGTPPNCGWPLVVFVHPLGQSRADDLALQGQIAGQGYAVWSYDVRAQGQALQANPSHQQAGSTLWGPVERCDLAEAIQFAAGNPAWTGLVDGSRIAVVGSSQGGVHGWNAAAWSGQLLAVPGRTALVFPNIDCVVCNDYVAEPIDDWLRGGVLWSSWFLEAIDGGYPVPLDPGFRQAARAAFVAQDPAALLAQFVAEDRPIAARLQQSTVPVLYSHAYHDLIDSPLPTLRLFETMAAPRRAMLSTIGHLSHQNVHEREFRDGVILRWLARWLWQDANEVELEAPFVLSEVPLQRTVREDVHHPWSRQHGVDPLVSAQLPRRFHLHDDGQLRDTPPALPQTAAVVVQAVDPLAAFTAADYLANSAARTVAAVLAACPLSEVVYTLPVAAEGQIDASATLHLRVVPQHADWQLAALLTVEPPGVGAEEVMLSSAAVAATSSTPGVAEEHELVLPPVAVRVPAGSLVRVRLRNLWLREAPMDRKLETAPRFHDFQVEIVPADAFGGSWLDLPLHPVRPKLSSEITWFPLATAPEVVLAVRAGQARAGQPYFVTAGVGGHLPITPFRGDFLPLEWDWLVGVVNGAWMQPEFQGFFGTLDANGEATARMDFRQFAPLPAPLTGLRLTYAAFVFDDFFGLSGAATNPCDVFLR
jgi:hypothetical protein